MLNTNIPIHHVLALNNVFAAR